jgi:hypothetical protein
MSDNKHYIKTLLDDIDMTKTVDENLEAIRDKNLNDTDLSQKWFYWFIKFEKVMEKCHPYGMYRRWGKYILLVPAWGANNKRNAEYYTFVLSQMLEEAGYKVNYEYNYSSRFIGIKKINDIPCDVWFNGEKELIYLKLADVEKQYTVEDMRDTFAKISALFKQ